MWTRSLLKENAKTALRASYWPAFAVALIVGILGGRSSGSFSYSSSDWSREFDFGDWVYPDISLIVIIVIVVLIVFLLSLAFSIFVSYPVAVGGNRWFSRNRESTATPTIGMTFSLFKAGSYIKTTGSMLWMNLFQFLWNLLSIIPAVIAIVIVVSDPDLLRSIATMGDITSFEELMDWFSSLDRQTLLTAGWLELAAVILSIPGFIKSISYRMTPWILADNPQIGYRRALRLSIEMTRGHKWAMFVLDLSFIGWMILGVLACGVGVLFVTPYIMATQAELYATLRHNGVSSGLCTMEELGFIPVAQPVIQQPSAY